MGDILEMIGKVKSRTLTALAALALMAACGNSGETENFRAIFSSLKSTFTAKKSAAPAGLSAQQLSAALGATTEPVVVISLEKRKAQAVMLRIAQNGPYQTFGNRERRSVVFREGMITATRGIGGDLMSSDISTLLPLVQSRGSGSAPYAMRFLDGEDKTQELRYNCKVSPGPKTPIAGGEINTTATLMNAVCTGDGTGFTNTYAVDPRGRIVGVRQWLGDYNEYIAAQPLRL